MDRASDGIRFDGTPVLPPGFDPNVHGPQDRATAFAILRRADDLLDESEPEQALALYGRLAAVPEADIAAAAALGAGNCLYRLDRDDEAMQAWESVTAGAETPATYTAWRQIAAARVRSGDLRGALDAYRQCEKRAPAADRAEIHSRLGWLSKETGNTGAASRHFARSRGDALPPVVTYGIIAVTAVVSMLALSGQMECGGYVAQGGPAYYRLMMDKILVADGELYRLLSVVLVHGSAIHLLFNMYALWYAGQLVERMYGPRLFVAFYVLGGIAGSMATFVFGDALAGVGASGAIFALFGIILVSTRYHLAILDAQSRAVASQIGLLIVINLAAGFMGVFGNVDNAAHIGGLAAGAWLALAIPPGRVPTLAAMWHSPRVVPSRLVALGRPALATVALVAVLVAGFVVGADRWRGLPDIYRECGFTRAPGAPSSAVQAGCQLSLEDR
jgi:membrane associated rhomboid family serine protease